MNNINNDKIAKAIVMAGLMVSAILVGATEAVKDARVCLTKIKARIRNKPCPPERNNDVWF